MGGGRYRSPRPPSVPGLTLAGTGHFVSFDGTRGVRPPRVWSPIDLQPRGKKHRVGRYETKPAVPSFNVICQIVTSEVRTMIQKSGKSGPDRTTLSVAPKVWKIGT